MTADLDERARTSVRELRANSGFGALGLLVPSVVIVLSYPLLLDRMGASSMGIFILASTLSPLALVLDLGIAQATTHFIASEGRGGASPRAFEALATSVAFYLVAGTLAAITVWLIAPWLADALGGDTPIDAALWAFRIGAIHMIFAFLLQPVLATFKGTQRFQLVALAASVVAVMSLGGAIAVVMLQAGVVSAMVGFTAGHALAVAIGYAAIPSVLGKPEMRPSRSRPSWPLFRELRRFGWPLMLGSVAGVMMYHPQRLVLGASLGPYAVTVYQLAAVIPSRVQALVATATEALFPFASTRPERAVLRRAYLTLLVGGGAVALTLLLVLVVGRESIMDAWIGGQVADDVAVLLPITSAAYFLITLSAAPYYVGIGLGRPHLVAAVYVGAASLNLTILMVMLIGGVSLIGVAWAFLLVNVLACIGYQLLTEFVLWPAIP